MRKTVFAGLFAITLLLASAKLKTAQAQDGLYGWGHRHAGSQVPFCARTPVLGYPSGYSAYYPGFSSYYLDPRISIARSSNFFAPVPGPRTGMPYVQAPGIGLGGFGNLGYPSLTNRATPQVQLRIGF